MRNSNIFKELQILRRFEAAKFDRERQFFDTHSSTFCDVKPAHFFDQGRTLNPQ